MADIFIFTVGDTSARERFRLSMEAGHDLADLFPFIDDEVQRDKLQQLYPDNRCYLWGETEKNEGESEWERLSEGDLVLGYREGTIISVSYVLSKMNDPLLAQGLWSDCGGNTCGLLFFTTRPHICTTALVPQMFPYLDAEYYGFTRLGAEKLKNILAHYGSVDSFARLVFGQDFPFSLRHSL